MSAEPPKPLEVYKGKLFARFARKARIGDNELWQAAHRANEGLIDADLGGGVIKQRIARAGEGKSRGSRSIVLFRKGHRAVFVFGFEKKDQADIGPHDLKTFRELAEVFLNPEPEALNKLLQDGDLIPIKVGQGERNG